MSSDLLTIVETASYLADAKKLMTDQERAEIVTSRSMKKENFDKLIAGMSDALAFVEGDTSRGQASVVEMVDVAGIRKKLGLSQSQFADRYGLERSVVQQWEQGRRRPDRAARLFLRVIEQNPAVAEAAARSGA
jgi:putative transcriptional regulator